MIYDSTLFDSDFYRKSTGRILLVFPAHHFHRIGWKLGLDPSRHFSVSYYLRTNPDIAKSGTDPLRHYIKHGWKEGRRPHPHFDQKRFIDEHKHLPRSKKLPVEQCIDLYGEARWPLRAQSDDLDLVYPPVILSRKQEKKWRVLFDEAYYRSHYGDLDELSVSPFQHFMAIGWREDRNPRAGFDMSHFKRALSELQPNAHPMRDVVQFRDRLDDLKSGPDLVVYDNNSNTAPQLDVLKLRIAVHFHAFYPEIIGELLPSVVFFPASTSFVITTCSHSDAAFVDRLITDQLDETRRSYVSIRVVENRGRDIGPLLVGCRDLWDDYDLLLHLHSKASPNIDWGDDWRSYLFDQLFGSRHILDQILSDFESSPNLGMLYPENYFHIKKFVNRRGNIPRIGMFLQDMPGFHPSMLLDDFAAGSMAWFRTSSYRALLDKVPNLEAFEIENGQQDFTFAHVLERALPITAKSAGFSVRAYSTALRRSRPELRHVD